MAYVAGKILININRKNEKDYTNSAKSVPFAFKEICCCDPKNYQEIKAEKKTQKVHSNLNFHIQFYLSCVQYNTATRYM